MARMKRVVHPIEPTMKDAPRYVVVTYPSKRRARYVWVQNRAEVRALKKKLKPGTYMEVFKVSVDFKEAWLQN